MNYSSQDSFYLAAADCTDRVVPHSTEHFILVIRYSRYRLPVCTRFIPALAQCRDWARIARLARGVLFGSHDHFSVHP